MGQPSVVVAGSLAQRPFVGGHTWVLLNYLLGFRQLGWDVHFVDRVEPGMCVDAHGRPAPPAGSANVAYLRDVMSRVGLDGRWTLGHDGWREVFGAPLPVALERARRANVLLNVMGFLDHDDLLGAAPTRVFLDIDPGFGQMWCALGLHDLFAGHDTFVTIGENIGDAGCEIPLCGREWITTKQPVALDHWPAQTTRGRAITSVVTWRGPFAPVEYAGRTYGLRVHEFRKFADLPRRAGEAFEIALDIDESDAADRERLLDAGWTLLDPASVAGDPWRYRAFVQASSAEIMVAKNLYVQTRSGWFSDRSACYLASGRPVVAQDTGLDGNLPIGEGLRTFDDVDEAAEAVKEVSADYPRHAGAARAIAEEHFAADRVLGRLVARLGVA